MFRKACCPRLTGALLLVLSPLSGTPQTPVEPVPPPLTGDALPAEPCFHVLDLAAGRYLRFQGEGFALQGDWR